MQIEVGKKYRTREGGTAEVLANDGVGQWPFKGHNSTVSGFVDKHASWTPEGRFDLEPGNEHSDDLVAEIDEVADDPVPAFEPEPASAAAIEAGGCAPPVVVEPPVRVAPESLADEAPAGPSIAEMVGAGTIPPPPEPLSIRVALPDDTGKEVQLIAALDQVMAHGYFRPESGAARESRQRAVDWLHAKYGSRP